MVDVSKWLSDNGFCRLIELFQDNEIDGEILFELTNDDLKDLGLPLGARKRLLRALESGAETLGRQDKRPYAHRHADAAERRQLTVMFVDLVGSTALSTHLDPEDLRDIIASYQHLVADVVTRYEGHVAKYMGDGVLCYFGWPAAHEDDAERAVRAGRAIMQELETLTPRVGNQLLARAGIATGRVVVGDLIGEGAAQEEAVVGETPNLAARLQDLANPGQVVLAESTAQLLGNLFELEDLGLHALKGISGKARAFATGEERSTESRFDARMGDTTAPMVGRDNELALILDRWQLAKGGEGQLVLLTGEAGIGKSRIARAMIDAVSEEPHRRLTLQCSPYHKDTSLYPVIQQLTQAVGIEAGDSNEDGLDKLEILLGAENGALLGPLLGLQTETRYGQPELEPQQLRSLRLKALAAYWICMATAGPVLFVLEDAHWIDHTTQELVDLCLDQVASTCVMMLVTARPNFSHGFGGHPIVTKLALNRLGREQIASIIDRLTGGKQLPKAVVDEITAKTDGVPLFVEELAKTVLESGLLRETQSDFELDGALHGLAIPSTLHDSLMARLDRLQPVKEVAQTAACIGREFDFKLLDAVTELSIGELEKALVQLVGAELVFQRGQAPEATYLFKHALVRDAAYESLLKSRRRTIHRNLLKALRSAGQVQPELLAHHATEGEEPAQAIDLWQLAGEQAIERSANVEAISHLKQALNLLTKQPENARRCQRELLINSLLAGALITTKGYGAPETVDIFDRSLELSREVDEPALVAPVLYGQWVYRFVKGAGTGAVLDRARALLEYGLEKNATGPTLVGYRVCGASLYYQGNLREAEKQFKNSIALYRPENHRALTYKYGQNSKAGAMSFLSTAVHLQGRCNEALGLAEEAMETARESKHINTVAYTLVYGLIRLCIFRGDVEGAARSAEELATIAEEHRLPFWEGYAASYNGWVLAQMGRHSEAVASIERGIALMGKTGTPLDRPMMLSFLAEAQLGSGNIDSALHSVDDALNAIAHERLFEPELLRLKGNCIVLRNGVQGAKRAEPAYVAALEIDRRYGAKFWELRAAINLAELWGISGKGGKARSLLQSVSLGLVKGPALPEVVAAKKLLETF